MRSAPLDPPAGRLSRSAGRRRGMLARSLRLGCGLLAALVAAPLPAQVNGTWTGPLNTASNWTTPGNWSTNPSVPNGAADSATISSQGVATVNAPIALQNFTLAFSGKLSGGGNAVTVSGTTSINGGGGAIEAGAMLVVNGSGTLDNPSGFSVTGTLRIGAGGFFTHQGNGPVSVFGGAGNLLIDGTWDATSASGGIASGTGNGTVTNNGTFIRNAAAAGDVYAVTRFLTNHGSIMVQQGVLGLTGTNAGSISVAGPGTLRVGTLELQSGSFWTGTGAVTFGLNSTLSVLSTLTITAGTFNLGSGNGGLPATVSVTPGRILTIVAATTLSTGGTISGGQVDLEGTSTITGASGLVSNAILRVPFGSTLIHNDPGASSFGAAVGTKLLNEGEFRALSNSTFNGAANTFDNYGTFTRTTGAGTYTMVGGFIQRPGSTVTAQTGVLQFNGSYAAAGQTQLSGSATVRFRSDTLFVPGATLTGPGTATVDFGGANTGFQDNLIIGPGVTLTNPVILTIPTGKTVTCGSDASLGGGGVTGGGRLKLTQGGYMQSGFTITGGSTLELGNGTVISMSSTAGLNLTTSFVQNDGHFTISGTGGVTGTAGSLFTNGPTGELELAPSSGSPTVTLATPFDSQGLLTVTGGTLNLTGAWSQVSGGTLTGGTVSLGSTLSSSGPPGSVNTIGPNATVLFYDGGSWPQLNLGNLTVSGELDAYGSTPLALGTCSVSGQLEVGAALDYSDLQIAPAGTCTLGALPPPRPGRAVGARARPPQVGPNVIGSGASQLRVGGLLRNLATGTLNGAVTVQNGGTLRVEAGTLTLTGCVTNSGTIVVRGGAGLTVTSGCFTNQGVIDLITAGSFSPGPGFSNQGVILDSSVVRVKTATRAGNTLTLTVDGYAGHTYQLQRSLSLSADSFVNLGAPQAAAANGLLTFQDANASGARGFYRVVVNP
ncbi:MAG: hypothetical protein JSR82_14755 [Verrucomicrobia bacterium]|nr:hypothetical protein [Verrucomicrobiota bacterium]